jgi:hypothetical protein
MKVSQFRVQLDRFQRLILANDKGHPFTNFHEGVVGVWEGYKPSLRNHALGILDLGNWSEEEIGSGTILRRTIDAIEIQDTGTKLVNNLVFWQNRFGHANRDHHILLDAILNADLRRKLERLLFDLYCGDSDQGLIFDSLSALTGAKYPLLAYLYFLHDINQFMPIQPTTFDRAFRNLGTTYPLS